MFSFTVRKCLLFRKGFIKDLCSWRFFSSTAGYVYYFRDIFDMTMCACRDNHKTSSLTSQIRLPKKIRIGKKWSVNWLYFSGNSSTELKALCKFTKSGWLKKAHTSAQGSRLSFVIYKLSLMLLVILPMFIPSQEREGENLSKII